MSTSHSQPPNIDHFDQITYMVNMRTGGVIETSNPPSRAMYENGWREGRGILPNGVTQPMPLSESRDSNAQQLRAEIASRAMASMIMIGPGWDCEVAAERAVKCADALLRKLSK